MNIYELHDFLNKQDVALQKYLKPMGLTMSSKHFRPTWKKIGHYYDVKEMTSLKLNIEFVRIKDG